MLAAFTVASAKLVSKNFVVNDGFASLNTQGIVSVVYEQAQQTKITAFAQDDRIADVSIEVGRNELIIICDSKDNLPMRQSEKVVVKVSSPNVMNFTSTGNSAIQITGIADDKEALRLMSTGNSTIMLQCPIDLVDLSITSSENSHVICKDAVEARSLYVNASGNSNVTISNLMAQNATAAAQENANVTLEGNGDTLNFVASGNSDIDATKYPGARANVIASGMSSVKFDAPKESTKKSGMSSIKNSHK